MSDNNNDVIAQKETELAEGEGIREILDFLKTDGGAALATRVLDLFATSKDIGANHVTFAELLHD